MGPPGPTVYIPPPDFEGERAGVSGDLYRHLFRARRLARGDALRVVDGDGHARAARIDEVGKDGASLALGESLPVVEPALRLTLLVAMPRPERASWLVEKATELGVDRILWLRTERGPRACTESVLERHDRVAQAAMQQCGGARLPRLGGPVEWATLAERLESMDGAWVLDAGGEGVPQPAADGRCGLLVGPEGGWTEAERAELTDMGCRSWSLGERVLRVETAALVGAGTLLSV